MQYQVSKLRFFLLFFLIAAFDRTAGFAQVSLDRLDLDGDIDSWFQQINTNVPPYLQGIQYNIIGQTRNQHQYYKSLSWVEGDLTFSGREFHKVEMLYNTYEDVLVIPNFGVKTSGVPAILLNQAHVDAFSMYGAKFIHLQDSQIPPPGKGFYELYYEGKNFTVLVKHSKLKDTSASGIVYKDKREAFILINDICYDLVNKKTLFNLYPEQKDELRKFMRNNDVKFSKQRQEGLKELLKFCDEGQKEG